MSQQRPDSFSPGPPSWPGTGLPPLPQPGSLPKDYHFPAPRLANAPTEQAVDEMPTLNLPAQPRKLKLRKGRAIGSLLVLLLLIGSGVGAFFAFNQSNRHIPKPIAQATAPATTQPSTSSVGTLGQPLQAGPNWIATITKVQASTSSDYPPKAGQTYLEISLTLKNVSPNTLFVSSMLEFTLTDNTGKQYSESVNDTYTRQAVDGHLTINQMLTGQVAYEVPQAQHQFVLLFRYGLPDGSDAAVSWNISMR